MKFSKILNVNSPFKKEKSDAGWDLYIPNIDEALISKILELNPNLEVIESNKYHHQVPDSLRYKYREYSGKLLRNKNNGFDTLFLTNDGKYCIFKPVTIPCGLQFLLPDGYYGEICDRSSNFKNNFEMKIGYIDNSYTFNSSFQIKQIDLDVPTVIEQNTRVAQLILKHNIVDFIPEELNLELFEKTTEVINNRNKRTGGIGSTGNT